MKKFLLKGDKDFALLFLRIFIGSFMLFGHGWNKLTAFGEYFHSFSDPLGLGPEWQSIHFPEPEMDFEKRLFSNQLNFGSGFGGGGETGGGSTGVGVAEGSGAANSLAPIEIH